MLRACVLEDHPAMREHIRFLVESLPGPWQVVYAGQDVSEAMSVGSSQAFDCVIADLDLGGDSGPTDIESIATLGWPLLVISAAGDPGVVQRAIQLGAFGFLPKEGNLPDLESALASLRQGEVFVSSDLAAKLAVPRLEGVALASDEQRALMLRSSGLGYAGIAASMGCTSDQVHQLVMSAIERYRRTS